MQAATADLLSSDDRGTDAKMRWQCSRSCFLDPVDYRVILCGSKSRNHLAADSVDDWGYSTTPHACGGLPSSLTAQQAVLVNGKKQIGVFC